MPDILIAGAVAVCGLLFGSFLNVCIYRMPRTGRVGPEDLRELSPHPEQLWNHLHEQGYLDEDAMVTGQFCAVPDAQSLEWPQADPALKDKVFARFRQACAFTINQPKRSFCPHCKKQISWKENIPVFSYVFLGGRCRGCRQKISGRYALVEVLTAALLVLLYYWFGLTPEFFVYSALVCALLVATFIDFDFYIIPDEITLGGLAVGLLCSALLPSLHQTHGWLSGVGRSLLGMLAGGGSIYLIGKFGELVFRKESMGGGDVKFMAMIGSVLGWQKALLIFFLAPFFGAFVGIIARLRRGAEVIPYGPYLSLATLLVILFGQKIISAVFLMY